MLPMSTSRAAASPYHHGDLRNALLDAASALAGETDAGGLALRAVARRAGVSHAAAYNHFSGKSDLLRALALRGFDVLRRDLEDSIASEDAGVADLAAAYVAFACDRPSEFRLMFDRSLCLPGDAVDPLEEVGLRAEAVLRSLIARRFPLRGADLDRAVLACWSQMHGLAVLVVETPAMKHVDRATASAMARDAAGLLESSLAAPARSAAGSRTASTATAPLEERT